MRRRRSLLALLALPLLPAEARAFRLEAADGETLGLLEARAEACASGRLHDELTLRLAEALARAQGTGEAEAAVRDALGTCPFCGCGLAFAAGMDEPARF